MLPTGKTINVNSNGLNLAIAYTGVRSPYHQSGVFADICNADRLKN